MNDSNQNSVTEVQAVPQARSHFPIVGIGASAGGLQALIGFFNHLDAAPGMAFVVVIHLSPTHESNAAEILQRSSAMPVMEVTGPCAIEADHVYVIAPNLHLEIEDGYLRVSDRELGLRSRPVAIDRLFRTLASAHGEHAFGVVLSGTGNDGCAGLAAIKHHGGVVIAQDPEQAEFAGMARAAIDAAVVDFILPVEQIGPKLQALRDNAQQIRLPMPAQNDADEADMPASQAYDSLQDSEEALREILNILRLRTGHDFARYKRATVLRRIERRLQVRERTNLPEYRDLLREDRGEAQALLKDMLIGVTQFFRDSEVFEAIERDIVPQLFADRAEDDQIRAWCVACATGEEAYSLAMLLAERAAATPNGPDFQMFASDIDERAIAFARAGVYGGTIADDLSAARLLENFHKEDSRYRIKKTLRDKILFAHQNLLRDPPFSKLDLISCRNLLIYLNRETHAQVLEMFHFALKPDGFLVLGTSESADSVNDFFVPVDKKNRIYQSRNAPRFARTSIPLGVTMPMHLASRHPERTEPSKPSYASVHQRVLAEYAPPSVLVDRQGNVVHMSDGMGQFLRHSSGVPTVNLVSLVEPALRLELRTALFQAAQTGKSVETRRVRLDSNGGFFVNMSVRPCLDTATSSDFVLVLFQKVEQITEEQVVNDDGIEQDAVLSGLEQELQRARAQLQETIEHSETSNEELKASNEELQAINEELRSATEELETSKEELQSVNEELTTVNYELKSKVEETSKVNDDLQNLIASTDLATIFVDRGMRIKRYTPQACQLFNLIPGDVGRPLNDINHKLDYPDLIGDAASSFENLRAVEREISSQDGRCFLARVLPYRTGHDRIDGAVLTFIDITSRREAEERARAGEERMRLVAASTKDYAIMTLDQEGRITSFNSGAERMFGYTEEEVLGQHDAIIFTAEDRAANIPAMEKMRARDDGRAEDERWHIRKDGSRVFCSGVMTPLRGGEFYGYAKIARDLTGKIQLQLQHADRLIEEQNQRAQAQSDNAQKDEFMAIMSHELKHPLNLIHMNAELLMRQPAVRSAPQLAKAVSTIRSSAISQAKIINDLLDLSRARTGKMELTCDNVDLIDLVGTIVGVLSGSQSAPPITIEAQEGPVTVHADPVRVEQVIWNLLSNALKFTPPEGFVRVTIGIEDSMAHLQVLDNGQGIRPEYLGTIFDIFGQGSASIVRGTKGLGIGLALVRQIVELHGGRVSAHSDGPGTGARFDIYLPIAGQDDATPHLSHDENELPLDGLEILIVDDSDEGLEAFQMLLQMAGAHVTSTNRARHALQLLGEQRFDVLISDLAMPEMDGCTLVREVRQLAQCADLPALAMTGLGRQVDIDRALTAGFNAHLSKPIDFEELVAGILKVSK